MGGMIRILRCFPTLKSQFAFIFYNPATNLTSHPPTLVLGLLKMPDEMNSICNVETVMFHVFLP